MSPPWRTWPRLRISRRHQVGTVASNRAQTGLPALAISLLLLTIVTGLGLAMADGAFAGADREPGERRVATSLAERLVAADSAVTERANVLNASELDRLDGPGLERRFPVLDNYDARVSVNGSAVASVGHVSGGTSFRRLVLIERPQTRELRPSLGTDQQLTLPRRTNGVSVTISPPAGSTVTTVRANDRVVLRNSSGLEGQFDVDLSRLETTMLRLSGSGPLPDGSVVVRYPAPRTSKAQLVVTVDG